VTLKRFARSFFDSFMRTETLDVAAQVAYFALLALFPFAMFVLTVVGYLPLQGIDRQAMDALEHVVAPDVAELLRSTLGEIVGKQRGWLLASTLVFALWTASGGIAGFTTALNRAYGVAETRSFWRVRVRAFGATLVGVVGALVATTAMLVGPKLVRQVWRFFGFNGAIDRAWALLRWPLATLAMTSMVAFMYQFLPNVHPRRRCILPGSIVAVLGWILASLGLRLYVGHFSSYAKTYGALGTVVVLLVWLYLWGLMIISGGQINAILDRRRGRVHTEKGPPPDLRHGS
jgi:membrane protein